MKKIILLIIGTCVLLGGLLVSGSSTQSASNLPYPEPVQGEEGLSACQKTMANQIYLMRSGYSQNLNTLLAQEKPTSDMVDEAFEGLRTYRCWLDYLCEAVLYSSNADPDATKYSGGKLSTLEIDQVPGCAKPENIQIPGTQIQYIPACSASGQKNLVNENTINLAQTNFADCHKLVEQDFADIPQNPSKKDVNTFGKDQSPAFIGLEKALKANSADQEVRPLRDKFESILLKMQGMENHMTFLKEQIESLDARIPCYCEKCD
jgi:hypothetical protein